jgi:hypothetical protein
VTPPKPQCGDEQERRCQRVGQIERVSAAYLSIPQEAQEDRPHDLSYRESGGHAPQHGGRI